MKKYNCYFCKTELDINTPQTSIEDKNKPQPICLDCEEKNILIAVTAPNISDKTLIYNIDSSLEDELDVLDFEKKEIELIMELVREIKINGKITIYDITLEKIIMTDEEIGDLPEFED